MVFDRGQIRPGGNFRFKIANQYSVQIREDRQKININTPLLPSYIHVSRYKSISLAEFNGIS